MPAVVDTAVKRIMEVAVARLFVTVVLLPVTVTVPKAFGLRPEDVCSEPSQLGRAEDILLGVRFLSDGRHPLLRLSHPSPLNRCVP